MEDIIDLNKRIEDCVVTEQFHQFEGTNACAYAITTDEGLTVVGTYIEISGIEDWGSARERARSDAMNQLRKMFYMIINMSKKSTDDSNDMLKSEIVKIIKK